MNAQDRCPSSNTDCEFEDEHELALVLEVMRAIERYNKKEGSKPCPLCLRNTMLAVSALLHLEASSLGAASMRKSHTGDEHLGNAFAEAARERLEEVFQANNIRPVLGRN
ncbi:MAG: hypothetical protein ACLPPF_16645 [Rhodomicrobium sp.]